MKALRDGDVHAVSVITQLYIAIELGYISKEQGMAFVQDAKHISVMLAKLIKIRKGTVR
ncbi:hypothetical protein WB703_003000 [Vibrio vulnificus]